MTEQKQSYLVAGILAGCGILAVVLYARFLRNVEALMNEGDEADE